MNRSDRTPLDPRTLDLIEIALSQVDKVHWPSLAEKQVPPQPEPPISLPPPRVPNLLLNTLQVYAGNLFKAEADQYDQLKTHRNYTTWLVNLADRTQARVFRTIDIIERANAPKTMAYHGLTDDEIHAGLSRFLLEIVNGYVWLAGAPLVPTDPPEQPVKRETESPTRTALRNAYIAAFPGTKILDICWAAGQRYREWKRWLKGELKDGSKPDGAFRRVLLSGKKPEEVRKLPRPPKWQ